MISYISEKSNLKLFMGFYWTILKLTGNKVFIYLNYSLAIHEKIPVFIKLYLRIKNK
eukprot:UN11123